MTTIVEAFAGYGSGHLSCQKNEILVNKAYAAEVDKYARQIYSKHFPNAIQLGSVFNVTKSLIPERVDILFGGSPCQGFSRAGKGLNFKDKRSSLFFEFARILSELKPRYFLFENVKMQKEWQDIISATLGVDPIEIDSSTVSAQTRVRCYWTNIPGVKAPANRNIDLIRIFDYHPQTDWESKMQAKIGPIQFNAPYIKINRKGNLKDNQNKSSCVCGGGAGDGNHSDMDLIMMADGTVRRYSPVECERLQTLPDGYTAGVSNTQRYKMLGNGWTVDVISHILEGYKHADPNKESSYHAADNLVQQMEAK